MAVFQYLLHMFISKTFQLYFKKQERIWFSSVQSLSSVWLCNPMDCSMPGFPVYHQLLEFAQTHVHRVGDAIQPSHPPSSPSPPAFNLSQHHGLFQWMKLKLQYFDHLIRRIDSLENDLISLLQVTCPQQSDGGAHLSYFSSSSSSY